MSKRFHNAVHAQNGACNALALANALADAINECRHENAPEASCPAVKLIAHQLSFLLNVGEMDAPSAYVTAMTRCVDYVEGAEAYRLASA